MEILNDAEAQEILNDAEAQETLNDAEAQGNSERRGGPGKF